MLKTTAERWLAKPDPDTALFNFNMAQREHIRDGSYQDLSHNCTVCLSIDRLVYEDDLYHGGKSPTETTITERLAELQHKNNLVALIESHGVYQVIDMLGEYCAEMEEDSKLDDQEPSARKWWCARVHIEHCSNLVEMIGL